MVVDPKQDFARRLNLALDSAEYPSGRGRRVKLASTMDVSGEAARKWLSGESIPAMDNACQLASILGCQVEWLLTGRGTQRPLAQTAASLTPEQQALLGYFGALTAKQRKDLLRELQETEQQNNEQLEQLLARRKAS